jgi:hypothetical protein
MPTKKVVKSFEGWVTKNFLDNLFIMLHVFPDKGQGKRTVKIKITQDGRKITIEEKKDGKEKSS